MFYLTREEHFSAAHRLFNAAWSDEKNDEIFGKCANKNWHGHNYHLLVTVKGDIDKETGYVMDAKILSDLILEHIIEKVDHKNLNLDVPFLEGVIPTAENLAKYIWQELEGHITMCHLHCIKLYETRKIYVKYYGE